MTVCILRQKPCILQTQIIYLYGLTPNPSSFREGKVKPNAMTEKTIHEGRNVKRIREILGIKQDALATELGLSQQAISALEQREKIDDKIMEDVAKVLKVPAEAIRNMTDEVATTFFNTFNDNSGFNYRCNINPLEKMVELYEALLKSEREKIALLERMIDKK